MIALDACAKRKIRRTAKNQIELLIRTQHGWIAKITVTKLVSMFELIVARAFPSQLHALLLRFNRDESRHRQTPRGYHSHRANAAAQIKNSFGARAPRRAVPRGQN